MRSRLIPIRQLFLEIGNQALHLVADSRSQKSYELEFNRQCIRVFHLELSLVAGKSWTEALLTNERLFQNVHLEGAHENHGHTLAGDGIAGPEVLARRLVVALDEALRRRPGEGAARPA